MFHTLAVILFAAVPNVEGAKVCAAVVETQNRACINVVDGFIPFERRAEARVICARALREGFEKCRTENGVAIPEPVREYNERQDAAEVEVKVCFNKAREDLRWCLTNRTPGSNTNCAAITEAAIANCSRLARTHSAESDKQSGTAPQKAGEAQHGGQETQPPTPKSSSPSPP